MRKKPVILYLALFGTLLLTGCDTLNNHLFSERPSRTPGHTLASTPENPAFWQGSPDSIWAKLQQIPLEKLQHQQTTNPEDIAWIKLATISKRYSINTPELVHALLAWRKAYPNHPGNTLIPDDATLNNILLQTPPKRIALLLPLSGKLAGLGLATRNGFMNAYNTEAAKTGYVQTIVSYDTTNRNLNSVYQEAVQQGANIIIGPLTKEDVKQLANQMHFTAPTIALNYSDVGFGALPTNLYEFGLSPHDEAKQVADRAFDAGHKHALIIAPQTEWGQSVAKTLLARWGADGGSVADTYYFLPNANLANEIPRLLHIDPSLDREKTHQAGDKATLEQQRRQDFDVVFLLAPPSAARQIVPLLRYYYVNNTAIYATSVVYSGARQPQKDADLNGVQFCDIPWILSHYGAASSDSEATTTRLYAVGADAYRLSRNISRFTALSHFPLYGATGAITLTPQQQFYRRLAWTQFHAGQV